MRLEADDGESLSFGRLVPDEGPQDPDWMGMQVEQLA
jgi:hypothetical protein